MGEHSCHTNSSGGMHLINDAREAAKWAREALQSAGYNADFSPDSLVEVDRFFCDHSENGRVKRAGLLNESLGAWLFAIGSYVGEVIRRRVGGDWQGDDSDEYAEINLALCLPDGTKCWPIQRVIKRFRIGQNEGIAVFGAFAGCFSKNTGFMGPETSIPTRKVDGLDPPLGYSGSISRSIAASPKD